LCEVRVQRERRAERLYKFGAVNFPIATSPNAASPEFGDPDGNVGRGGRAWLTAANVAPR
jgi:hypothetical protein